MSAAPTETVSLSTLNTSQSIVCECGLSRYSSETYIEHIHSEEHIRIMENPQYDYEECVICMSGERVQKYKCSTCNNRHCVSCHTHIQRCPFCRTPFPTEYNRQTRSYFWQVLVPRLYWLRYQARLDQTHNPEFRRVFTIVHNAYYAYEDYFRQNLHLLHCYEAICHMVYSY